MSQAKCAVTQTPNSAVFTFSTGSVVTAEYDKFSDEIKAKFLAYGVRQKLQDSYASKKDPKEAEEALIAQLERIYAGEWTQGRAAGTGGNTTKLVLALINITGKAQTEVEALLEALSEEQIKALRNKPVVAAELAKMRAEELAKAAQASIEAGDSGLGI